MILLDDRCYRPVQRTRISLDMRLIGYKAGFKQGIITGAILGVGISILFLVFR